MRDRGITTAFNYVILLGITSILMSTLIIGVSGLVTTQQTDGIHAEFKVYGNKLAEDTFSVSHLAAQIDRNGQGSVDLTSALPRRIVGNQYTITVTDINDHPRYELTLRTDHPDVVVTINFKVNDELEDGDVETGQTLNGGPIEISYSVGDKVRFSDD